ncbi:MAG: transposase [Actinobacteria bacterium]|nr:transposase [Actinomycetota bacterium]
MPMVGPVCADEDARRRSSGRSPTSCGLGSRSCSPIPRGASVIPGRSRYCPRACLEGTLYVLFTDTPWLEVPYRELSLPSGETCRRRLEEWSRRGVLEAAIAVLCQELSAAGALDWSRRSGAGGNVG